jgi:uncharacterized protein
MAHDQLLKLTHEMPISPWVGPALVAMILVVAIGSIREMKKKPHARWLLAFALVLLVPLASRCLRRFYIGDERTYLLLALLEPPLMFLALFCFLGFLEREERLTPELTFGAATAKLFVFLTCLPPAFGLNVANPLIAFQISRALTVTGLCLVGGAMGFHALKLSAEKRRAKAGLPTEEKTAFFADGLDETGEAPPSRKAQVLELLVVLLLMLPSLLSFPHSSREGAVISFSRHATSNIQWEIPRICLLLFLLWRNREPMARIGLTGKRLGSNMAIGVAGYFVIRLVSGMNSRAVLALGLPHSSHRYPYPHHPGELAYSVVYVVIIALAEEIFYRGYLLLRLSSITRSLPAAVLISSLLFAFEHGYQGWPGVISAGLDGVFFTLICLERKSLVPPIVIHFLLNFRLITLAKWR